MKLAVQWVDNLLSYLSKTMGIVASIAVLIVLIVTSLDVILLKILSKPIPGASELIGVFMPFIVFGFLLETQRKERHITVDIFTNKINSTKKQFLHKIFINFIWLALIFLVTWYIIPEALHSTQMKEHVSGLIPYPIFYAKLFTAFAFLLVSIQSFINIFKLIYRIN